MLSERFAFTSHLCIARFYIVFFDHFLGQRCACCSSPPPSVGFKVQGFQVQLWVWAFKVQGFQGSGFRGFQVQGFQSSGLGNQNILLGRVVPFLACPRPKVIGSGILRGVPRQCQAKGMCPQNVTRIEGLVVPQRNSSFQKFGALMLQNPMISQGFCAFMLPGPLISQEFCALMMPDPTIS